MFLLKRVLFPALTAAFLMSLLLALFPARTYFSFLDGLITHLNVAVGASWMFAAGYVTVALPISARVSRTPAPPALKLALLLLAALLGGAAFGLVLFFTWEPRALGAGAAVGLFAAVVWLPFNLDVLRPQLTRTPPLTP